MPISIPDNIARDIREPIAGDSFGWEAIEPAAAKKSIVIHATASEAPDEDGFTMADYHVNHNGWGGIGVHFVVTKDSYQGRPGITDPGAHAQYVGDLLTWRAGTVNQNPGRVHIEISGLFTAGNGIPSAAQLRAARGVIDFLLAPNEILPSLNYPSQVTYHNAVPGQNTACPGWDHPSFQAWFAYLQGGPFPDALYPAETPATPEPTGQPQADVIPVIIIPEYESSWTLQPDTMTVQQPGAFAIDATTGAHLTDIAVGTVVNIAGYFTFEGVKYARTVWATENNKWNGIATTDFAAPGQTAAAVIPVTVSDTVASNVTDQQLTEATVPETPKVTLIDLLKEIGAWFVALFIKGKK